MSFHTAVHAKWFRRLAEHGILGLVAQEVVGSVVDVKLALDTLPVSLNFRLVIALLVGAGMVMCSNPSAIVALAKWLLGLDTKQKA